MGLPAVEPPASTAAAHRRFEPGALRKIAVVLSWMLGAALQELWFAVPPPDEGGLSSQFEIALAIGSLVIAVVAAAVGCIWARRTQRAFVMRKLFRQLSPSDQTDVIDLVKTLPR